MRPVIAFTCIAVALVAFAPAISAICIPTCDVVSAGRNGGRLVFVPAATLLQSGDILTWSTTDGLPHIAASDDGSFCFVSPFSAAESGSALFFIEAGALFAIDAGGEPLPCTGARALPGGGFLLDYYCPFHPTDMQAELVVQP